MPSETIGLANTIIQESRGQCIQVPMGLVSQMAIAVLPRLRGPLSPKQRVGHELLAVLRRWVDDGMVAGLRRAGSPAVARGRAIMSTDVRELAIMVDGKTRLRFLTQVGDAEAAMALSDLIAKIHGRVAVVITGADLVSKIICRRRS